MKDMSLQINGNTNNPSKSKLKNSQHNQISQNFPSKPAIHYKISIQKQKKFGQENYIIKKNKNRKIIKNKVIFLVYMNNPRKIKNQNRKSRFFRIKI